MILKRKAVLLMGEVLMAANRLLPSTYSESVQLLPELFASATKFYDSEHFIATTTVYQIDSVNRTLFRSGTSSEAVFTKTEVEKEKHNLNRSEDPRKSNADQQLDESQFRSMMLDTQVLTSHSAN